MSLRLTPTEGSSMNGQNIGYIRVSSVDQNLDRQLDGLQLDKIFEDKASGKDISRPGFTACLGYIREGDCLHVHSIDRLARNLADLQKIVSELVGRGVAVIFHKENLTFDASGKTSPMQDLMFQMLGAFAQFERALIRERQREGIALAKKQGKKLGRGAALDAAQIDKIKSDLAEGKTITDIAAQFGVSRPTIYKYAKS